MQVQAQITTLYRAKYAVTIMGKDYLPGEKITDPKIDGKVLRRLADNGRVVLVPSVHVPSAELHAGEFDDDEPDDPEDDDDEPEGDAPAAPAAPAEGDPPSEVEGVAVAAVKAAAQPAPMNVNAAWKAAFAKNRKDGETLKGYLQRVLQENKINANGPVQELVNRLASAGVQPGVAGH
jgi:hypothetical protein